MNRTLIVVIFLAICCVGPGCVTDDHPTLDYVLAREAFSAASEVEAPRYAPGYFHKAEESFRVGERYYQEKSFSEAIEEFRAARHYAEKAENATRVLRQKAGDEGM